MSRVQKPSLRIKKSPVQRKNQKRGGGGTLAAGFLLRLMIKKKVRKSTLPAGKTHTHEPTHTLLKRVGCTTFPTSLDGAAEVAEPRSPAERLCAAAGCGFYFFFLFYSTSPFCAPGVLAPWSSLHSTSSHHPRPASLPPSM